MIPCMDDPTISIASPWINSVTGGVDNGLETTVT